MTKSKILIVCLLIVSACSNFAQNLASKRPVPQGIYPYQFETVKKDSQFHAYFLISPFLLGASADSANFVVSKPMILDENGYIAWYLSEANGKMNSIFSHFEKEARFGWMNIAKDGKTSYIFMDAAFQITDTVQNIEGILSDAHEILMLENGNYLIGGKSFKTYNKKRKVFVEANTDNDTLLKTTAFVIQELDKNHKLVFQWDSNAYLSPEDFIDKYDTSPKEFDYCHGNAIAQDAKGDFWVSFRNFDAVYKISHTTGKVLLKLGGKSNQFRFVNDKGFSGQHNVRVQANGNLTLYDNGTQKPKPQYSRAVEYQLDTINMTATKVWESSENVYGKSLGSYQKYKDKYHLINYGFLFNPSPNISLINNENEILAHIRFRDSVMNYRAQIADIQKYIHRPKITTRKTKAGIELSAPKNCSKYMWSTGERTQKIVVNSEGVYQVWVPQGIGMSGSLPYKYTIEKTNIK